MRDSLTRILAVTRIETLRLLVDRPSLGPDSAGPGAATRTLRICSQSCTEEHSSCNRARLRYAGAVGTPDGGPIRAVSGSSLRVIRRTQLMSTSPAGAARASQIDCRAGEPPHLLVDASDPSAVGPGGRPARSGPVKSGAAGRVAHAAECASAVALQSRCTHRVVSRARFWLVSSS